MPTDTDLEAVVNPARLDAYLQKEMGPGPQASVESHVAGFSNITCYVYRGETEYVLRRPPAGPLLPTAHDVAREFRFLSALHGTAARVPEPFLLCEDDEVIGAPFYLMERKRGHVLRDKMPVEFDSAEARKQIGLEMIDTLAELHGVNWQSTGLTGKTGGYLDRQLHRWQKQADLTVNKVRELPELQKVSDWLVTGKPMESETTVVHGDFKLDNVMFAEEGPPKIIALFDWEMATIGDPLADLGWLMHTWGLPPGWQGDADAQLPLTAQPDFATREELAARYEELTGRHMAHFEWYHVLAIWKLAIILEGLYVHYKTGTASNPASDRFEIQVPDLITRAQLLMSGKA